MHYYCYYYFTLFVPKASVAVVFISQSEIRAYRHLRVFVVSNVGQDTDNSYLGFSRFAPLSAAILRTAPRERSIQLPSITFWIDYSLIITLFDLIQSELAVWLLNKLNKWINKNLSYEVCWRTVNLTTRVWLLEAVSEILVFCHYVR
jgi:hypothetical protein